MSETQVIEQPNEQHVTIEDLQQMLDEAKERGSTLEQERDSERRLRQQAEADRQAEREARLITETERDGAAARVVSEAEQRYNLEKDSVKTGIAAHRATVESAEDAYARHAETGDWKAAAAEQRRMAEASAKITQLEARQEFLETNKERFIPPVQRSEPREVRGATGDRITQLVKDVSPAEHAWLSKRPQFIDDPAYRDRVFKASGFATTLHSRNSEGYFREIERLMGESTETPPAEQRPARRESTDIAPQRRATPGSQPSGGRQWVLTPEQREAADDIYGNPSSDMYVANEGDRYKKYWDNMEYQKQRGRL